MPNVVDICNPIPNMQDFTSLAACWMTVMTGGRYELGCLVSVLFLARIIIQSSSQDPSLRFSCPITPIHSLIYSKHTGSSFSPSMFLVFASFSTCLVIFRMPTLRFSTSIDWSVVRPFSFSSRLMRVRAAARPIEMAKMGSRDLFTGSER
jgi:hypothetical protein